MDEVIVGTSNPAKQQMFRDALAPLCVHVRGTNDLGIVVDVDEDGATAQENARKKSLAYVQVAGALVVSIDNALFFDGVPDGEQPGVATRRVPGADGRLSDDALLAYYAERIAQLGGRVGGYWEFAICAADAQGHVFETTIRSRRTFVSTPSSVMIPGYPLESLQIDPESGRYCSELSAEEQAAFWQRAIGVEVCAFMQYVQAQLVAPTLHEG